MTGTAETDLVAGVEGRLREVAQAGAPFDARRDARRRTAPMALRSDARVPVTAGQGAAARAVPVGRPGVRRGARRRCWASPSQSSCCTTRFSSTTTSPTAARCAVADRHWPPSYGMARRAQRRRRAGHGGRPGAAQGHPAARPRPRRPGLGRVRHHGDAHAGGSGHRGRLAGSTMSRTCGPRTTST